MMSVTPGSNKSSPFGNAINKNLLTPCRRVGLSRKRSKSNSITKLLSKDLNNSNSSISENTPINNVSTKRKNRTAFDSPADTHSTTKNSKKIESKVKKSLNQCFGKDENAVVTKICEEVVQCNDEKTIRISTNKEVKSLEIQLERSRFGQNTNSDSFKKESNHDIKIDNQSSHIKSLPLSENICSDDDIKSDSSIKSTDQDSKKGEHNNRLNISIADGSDSNQSSPKVRHGHKRNILYDSDDEFKITENMKAQLKTYERKKSEDKKSTGISDTFKDCTINIPKISVKDITVLEENSVEKITTISSDEEDMNIKKKIKLNEDSDYQDLNTKKSVKTKKEPTEKLSKNKDPSKVKRNKMPKVTSLTLSNAFEEDDDDAFTSTPDREKNEKRELIGKIKVLEKIVNDKTIKLDNLKRASLYKTKHNIEDLNNLTEIWRKGCMLGLEGLLKQLQAHGPMDMTTLLKNLHISQEMSSKMFVNTI